jgi:hypothetical protein
MNSRIKHIKLPERDTVLMVHDSINKKYGTYLKYSKYGAFILLVIQYALGSHLLKMVLLVT